jgi:hypothetical protein
MKNTKYVTNRGVLRNSAEAVHCLCHSLIINYNLLLQVSLFSDIVSNLVHVIPL